MKKLVIALALCSFVGSAYAAETVGESGKSAVNDAKRAVKKGVNRTKEAVCAEGDLKCLKEKGAHRVEEGSDYAKDKTTEVKDKVD